MASDSEEASEVFAVTLTRASGFRFEVTALDDEPCEGFAIEDGRQGATGQDFDAVRVLASAMASCLGSSLVYCLQKSQIQLKSLRVVARGEIARNDRQRLRVRSLHIELFPEVATADAERMRGCLGVFEDFCIVTESVRKGFPVVVGVESRAS
ncbi:MAG: OsmC family protein [Gemmatimonadaceae bacterium]